MKSLRDYRTQFIKLLEPFAAYMDDRGVTPVQLMLGSAAMTLVAGLLIAAAAPTQLIFAILPLVLFLRLALNATDDILVKEHKKESKIAFYIGELGDVFSDIVLYLPFIFIPGISQILVIFSIFGAIFTEFAGVLSLQFGKIRRYEGPMGKVDRAVAFSFVAVIYGFDILGVGWINFFLTIIFLAEAMTIYNRVMLAISKGK